MIKSREKSMIKEEKEREHLLPPPPLTTLKYLITITTKKNKHIKRKTKEKQVRNEKCREEKSVEKLYKIRL